METLAEVTPNKTGDLDRDLVKLIDKYGFEAVRKAFITKNRNDVSGPLIGNSKIFFMSGDNKLVSIDKADEPQPGKEETPPSQKEDAKSFFMDITYKNFDINKLVAYRKSIIRGDSVEREIETFSRLTGISIAWLMELELAERQPKFRDLYEEDVNTGRMPTPERIKAICKNLRTFGENL